MLSAPGQEMLQQAYVWKARLQRLHREDQDREETTPVHFFTLSCAESLGSGNLLQTRLQL